MCCAAEPPTVIVAMLHLLVAGLDGPTGEQGEQDNGQKDANLGRRHLRYFVVSTHTHLHKHSGALTQVSFFEIVLYNDCIVLLHRFRIL